MKIQLAVDYTDLDEARKIISEAWTQADIIEIGTPLVLSGGAAFVKEIREKYPDIILLADAKIMDGGTAETKLLLSAGADIVTVMAVTNDETIRNVVKEAHACGKKCLADMMLVKNIEERTRQLDAVGVDYICAHTAYDVQSSTESPLAELETICRCVNNSSAAIAGGINAKNVSAVAALKPEIIITGGYVCNSEDKVGALKLLRERIDINA